MLRLDDLNDLEMIKDVCKGYSINVCTIENDVGEPINVWCWDRDLYTGRIRISCAGILCI